jgi:hypothetical protein
LEQYAAYRMRRAYANYHHVADADINCHTNRSDSYGA